MKAGPRLISCSDDMSIRVWGHVPKDKPELPAGQIKTPSIWKNRDFEEEWVEEMRFAAGPRAPGVFSQLEPQDWPGLSVQEAMAKSWFTKSAGENLIRTLPAVEMEMEMETQL